MIENIAPGDTVTVKIVKQPTNAAARKTLVRVLSKDAAVQRENDHQRKVRKTHAKPKQRGGRTWISKTVKQRPVEGKVGEAGSIRATVDVIRDLGSVDRFIEVSKA